MKKGWKAPTVTDIEEKATTLPEDEWLEEQHKVANGNSKAMNAMFFVIDESIFKLISNTSVWFSTQSFVER